VEIEWEKTGESIRKRVKAAHNVLYRHNRWLVIEGEVKCSRVQPCHFTVQGNPPHLNKQSSYSIALGRARAAAGTSLPENTLESD